MALGAPQAKCEVKYTRKPASMLHLIAWCDCSAFQGRMRSILGGRCRSRSCTVRPDRRRTSLPQKRPRSGARHGRRTSFSSGTLSSLRVSILPQSGGGLPLGVLQGTYTFSGVEKIFHRRLTTFRPLGQSPKIGPLMTDDA
jgi:hypothetical protein